MDGERERERIAVLLQRASNERRRAARVSAVADEFEARRAWAPARWQPQLAQLVETHRSMKLRHLEAARLQESYAFLLDRWSCQGDAPASSPGFIAAVASAIGRGSAAVTLVGRDGAEALVAASDRTARIAGDIEFVLGEGPAHDVAAGKATVRAEGRMLLERWPCFGAAIAEHGVGSVISHPLQEDPDICLGALCVFEPATTLTDGVATNSARVADALAHIVLDAPGAVLADEVSAATLLDEAGFLATLHQAAGVVSVQHSCQIGDAVALLRARAFADGVPVETVSQRVIRGELQL